MIDQQSGSAHAMLDALVTAPETGLLAPMLVTGKTVAGAPGTLLAFRAWLPDRTLRRQAAGRAARRLDDPAAAWSDRGRAATG